MANDARNCRVWVGNLPPRITEELLFELFIQAGPVEEVFLPKHNNKPKQFAFVTFKHQCSVSYAKELFKGTKLFGKDILIEPKMRESIDNNNESINSSNHINGIPKMQTREDFSHLLSNTYSLVGNSSKGVREMKTIDNNNQMNYRDVDFYGKSQYHSRSQNSHLMPTEKLNRNNKSKSNNEVDFDQLLKMANELVNPLPVNSSNVELQKYSNNMSYRNDARNCEYYSNRNRKHFDKTRDHFKDSNSHLDDDRFPKDMRQRKTFDREENIPRHRNDHYNNFDGDRNLESHRVYNINPNRARGRDFNQSRDNGPRQFDKNHSFRHNDRYNRSTPYHHYSNSHRR